MRGESPVFERVVIIDFMSIEESISVECPKCKHEQDIVVWSSLNAQVSPEAKAQFISGDLNVFVCQECEARVSLAMPLLYHDMELQFCVQFYPPESLEDEATLRLYEPDGSVVAGNVFSSASNPDMMEKMRYVLRPHVVFSMQEALMHVLFRENLALFHAHGTSA